jgi:hypothetical protein
MRSSFEGSLMSDLPVAKDSLETYLMVQMTSLFAGVLQMKEETTVKTLRSVYLTGLLLGVMLLITSGGWAQFKPETKAPIITNSYAEDTGPYGTVWKIYVEAEDRDADMDYVAVEVDQPGVGRYPTDYILLDPQHRNHLKGFLQWNTFSSRGTVLSEGTQITVRVSIIDKAGNESNKVVFPFTFVSGDKGQNRLPDVLDETLIPRLGYISIDLIRPDSG